MLRVNFCLATHQTRALRSTLVITTILTAMGSIHFLGISSRVFEEMAALFLLNCRICSGKVFNRPSATQRVRFESVPIFDLNPAMTVFILKIFLLIAQQED